MSDLLQYLVRHGQMLLAGSSLLLAVGTIVVFVQRSPVHRQRSGELTALAALVWLVLANVPMPRLSLEGWTPMESSDRTRQLSVHEQMTAERTDNAEIVMVTSDESAVAAAQSGQKSVMREPGVAVELHAAVEPSTVVALAAVSAPSDYGNWFAAIFLTGTGVCISWLLLGSVLLWRMLRSAGQPDDWLLQLYRTLPCRQRPELLISPRASRAFSFGLARPVIVLPKDCCSADNADQLRAVLLHELAHCEQGDARGRLLFNFAFPFLYFHPLYWLIRRRTFMAAELIADDRAAAQTSRVSYTRELIALVRASGRRARFSHLGATPVFESRSCFCRRMEMLMHRKSGLPNRCTRSRRAVYAMLFVMVVAVCAGLLGIKPTQAQTGKDNTEDSATDETAAGAATGGLAAKIDTTIEKKTADESAATQPARGNVLAEQPQQDKAEAVAEPESKPDESKAKTVIVSDERFEQAAKTLRDVGGSVRSFHPRTSTKNWVQVILDAEKLTATIDDDSMDAVKLLSTDSETHFHARNCDFSAEGLAKLAGTKVSRLELTGSNITDAHLKTLNRLSHLTELTLAETSISESGFAAIGACKQLNSIGLAQNSELSDTSLAMLSRLPKLTSVSIHKSLTDAAVSELNKVKGLVSLRLKIASDEAIEAFMSLECLGTLEQLTLSGEIVSEQMMVYLAENTPHLKTLYLRGSQDVSNQAVTALAELPLEVLAFDGTNITDAGVSLLKPLTKLRWLDLTGTKVTDRSLIAVGNMHELRFLGLRQTDISESGLKRLQRLEKLAHIDLQLTAVRTIPVWMKQRERLYVSFDGGRPLADHPPNAKDDSGLAIAVTEFNKAASKHPIGKFEPPLTVDEVVAAIRSWNRERFPIDNETLAIFQRIAETKELPEGAKIESTSGWRTGEFHYTVWWINLNVMTGERRGYGYRLRARTLASRRLDK